jgi:uncharacterized protein YcgI (DUF1989 family)
MPGAAIPGRIVDDRVIPARGDWSGVVPAGKVLRIVDLEGRQAVDFLCYSAADPSERYNAADTMKFAKTIFLTTRRHLRPARHDRRVLQRRVQQAPLQRREHPELPGQLPPGARALRAGPEGHRRQRELLHERAGRG